MTTKSYVRLLQRLVRIREMAPGPARRVFEDLLTTSFGDVVELGIRLEARQAVRKGTKPIPWRATDEEISQLQKEIYERLRDDTRTRGRHRNPNVVGQGITLYSALLSTPTDKLRIEVHGPINELLAMQAYLLSRAVGTERLRVCDCDALFVRTGKQEYCSKRCQKRVYMRQYRAEDG